MKIVTPLDKEFDFKQCEKLYNEVIELMGNECSFLDLVLNSHFFSYYEEEKLVGCIYVNEENGKLFLSGFSVRKNHKFNIGAVKKAVQFYNCDIFSKTKNRTAEILLKKCGFKLIKTDLDGMKYLKKEK